MGGSGLCSRVIKGPRLRETFQVPLDVNIQVRERETGERRGGEHTFGPSLEGKQSLLLFPTTEMVFRPFKMSWSGDYKTYYSLVLCNNDV